MVHLPVIGHVPALLSPRKPTLFSPQTHPRQDPGQNRSAKARHDGRVTDTAGRLLRLLPLLTARPNWRGDELAEFWALALDYVLEPPPHGFETWEDFGRSIGMAEEKFGDQAAVIDPADEGPRLYFQRVPERKTVKNRVHLDVRVAGREVEAEERKQLMSEKAEQLVQAGASVVWVNEDVRGHSIVLRDPEGNEFCVA